MLKDFVKNKFLIFIPMLVFIFEALCLDSYKLKCLNGLCFCILLVAFISCFRKHKNVKKLSLENAKQTKLLSTVFDYAPDYFMIKDTNSNYVFANKAFLKFRNLKSIDNTTDFDYFDEEIAKACRAADEEIIRTAKPKTYEVYNDNNSEKYFQVTKVPLLGEDKEVFGILCTVRDITSDKLYKEKLEKEQLLLSTIIDHIPFIAYLRDVDGNLLYKNKYCDEWLCEESGLDGAELLLKFFRDNRAEIEEMDRDIIRYKQPYCLKRKFYIKNVSYYFDIYKIPILRAGNVDKLLIVAKDITLDKEIEEQKETFVATLTHDLKTPINAKLKAVEYLLNHLDENVSPDCLEILNEVYNSCKYMQDMVNTLITTYRYNDGKVELKPEHFDLVDLIKNSCSELKYLYLERQQRLKFDFEIYKCEIYADKLEIKRVITNLLSNAISYSCSNSDITIQVMDSDGKVEVHVINNGKYLYEEDLNLLFEKFVSKGKTYKRAASGLGLYLSKQIIELHGGKIYARRLDQEYIFGFVLYRKKMRQEDESSLATA